MFASEDRPTRRTTDFPDNRAARTKSTTLCYGRFLQADPLGYEDGMNMYDYVGGDPVNMADPTGTVADPATILVVGSKLAPLILPTVAKIAVSIPVIGKLFSFLGGKAKPPKIKNDPKQSQNQQNTAQHKPVCPTVPSGGAGAGQISKNIAESSRQRAMNAGGRWSIFAVPALEGGTGAWFASQVKTGGAWDYKNQGYSAGQNYGNFNYGATSAALGYDWPTTMGGENGYSLIDHGTLESQSSVIRAGFDYARMGCNP